jgi:hypothetical protein
VLSQVQSRTYGFDSVNYGRQASQGNHVRADCPFNRADLEAPIVSPRGQGLHPLAPDG